MKTMPVAGTGMGFLHGQQIDDADGGGELHSYAVARAPGQQGVITTRTQGGIRASTMPMKLPTGPERRYRFVGDSVAPRHLSGKKTRRHIAEGTCREWQFSHVDSRGHAASVMSAGPATRE